MAVSRDILSILLGGGDLGRVTAVTELPVSYEQ
jgi:hypothetical protein